MKRRAILSGLLAGALLLGLAACSGPAPEPTVTPSAEPTPTATTAPEPTPTPTPAAEAPCGETRCSPRPSPPATGPRC